MSEPLTLCPCPASRTATALIPGPPTPTTWMRRGTERSTVADGKASRAEGIGTHLLTAVSAAGGVPDHVGEESGAVDGPQFARPGGHRITQDTVPAQSHGLRGDLRAG